MPRARMFRFWGIPTFRNCVFQHIMRWSALIWLRLLGWGVAVRWARFPRGDGKPFLYLLYRLVRGELGNFLQLRRQYRFAESIKTIIRSHGGEFSRRAIQFFTIRISRSFMRSWANARKKLPKEPPAHRLSYRMVRMVFCFFMSTLRFMRNTPSSI